MAQELGDYGIFSDHNIVRSVPSDASGSAGDAVKVNSSDQVTRTTANDDDIYGVLAEDSPSSSGDEVQVVTHGDVIANAGSSVTEGEIVIADSSTKGRLSTNSDGTGKVTDVDGTTDQGIFAPANPEALVDSGGTLPSGNSLGSNECVFRLK